MGLIEIPHQLKPGLRTLMLDDNTALYTEELRNTSIWLRRCTSDGQGEGKAESLKNPCNISTGLRESPLITTLIPTEVYMDTEIVPGLVNHEPKKPVDPWRELV